MDVKCISVVLLLMDHLHFLRFKLCETIFHCRLIDDPPQIFRFGPLLMCARPFTISFDLCVETNQSPIEDCRVTYCNESILKITRKSVNMKKIVNLPQLQCQCHTFNIQLLSLCYREGVI